MSAHRAAVAYVLRAESRHAWRSWIALGILVGLSTGAVMAAAAGARRTSSAYTDLLAETATPDGLIVPACGPDADRCPPPTEFAATVRGWPGVEAAGAVASVLTPIADDRGVWQVQGDACNTGTGEVSALVPLDEHVGRDLFRLRILEGRDVAPGSTDEAVLAPESAALHGVEVGDTLQVHLEPGVSCEDRSTWGRPTEVTVVGIGLSGMEVPPKTGFYIQGLHLSPALASLPVTQQPEDGGVLVRLESGTTFDDLQEAASPGGFMVAFDRVRDLRGDDIEAGLRSDANALWLVAGLGALGAALVLGPTLARQRLTVADTDRALTAFGWSRGDRGLRSAAHGMAIGVVAAVTALTVATVGSSWTPIGDARAIEPDPGPEFDRLVGALGATLTIVAVSVLLAGLAMRSTARPSRDRRTPLATFAGRLGLPTTAVLGVRIGLEPGPRRAPVRSSVFTVAVGLAAVIGVLVYTAGAEQLRESPALRGVPWDDLVITEEIDGATVLVAAREWPEVEAISTALVFNYPLVLGEDHVAGNSIVLSTGPMAAVPTVIEGRAPVAPDEVLLNPRLADTLDVEVGDQVEAAFDLEAFQGPGAGRGPAFTLRIVGTGPVPIGDGRFESGLTLTREGYLAQLRRFAPPEEVAGTEAAANALAIDRTAGTSRDAIAARLAEIGISYDFDPAEAEDFLDNIVDADATSTEAAPDLLAGLMAGMGALVLAYGLTLTVTRSGHDLAVARALGLTPRLVRRTSRMAGVAFTAVALVVAVPVGLVVGRVAWRRYAEGLGVVADPVVPAGEVAALIVATLLIATLAAGVSARLHLRHRPGSLLRAE